MERKDLPKIRAGTKLKFHRLKFGKEADEHGLRTVIRWDTDTGITGNEGSIEILRNLYQGKTVEQTALAAGLADKKIVEEIDNYFEAGLVDRVDGVKVTDITPKIRPWFVSLARGRFAWVLSPVIIVGCLMVIVSGLVIGIFHYQYFPTVIDYFWAKDLFVAAAAMFFLNYLFVFIHELAHFVAAKAVGGEARMRFGKRFIDVVAETDLYHLGLISKSRRYITYLSGIFVDILSIAIIFWLFWLSDLHLFSLGVTKNLMSVVILLQMNAILWEFGIVLTTDIYYFLSDLFSFDYLHADAQKYLVRKILRWSRPVAMPLIHLLRPIFFSKEMLKLASDQRLFQKKDKRRLTLYFIFSFVGIVLTLMMFVFFTFPRGMIFIAGALGGLVSAWRESNLLLGLKSLAILFVVGHSLVVLVFIYIEKLKKKIKAESV